MALPVPALNLQNQKISNLADGTLAADAATWGQVQALLRGLDWKNSVKAATTANITLSGTQTIDGVSLVAGDRVLVKNQTTGADNGIYVVAAGAWSRATDYDDNIEVTAASSIPVEQGTANGDSVQILTTDGTITIGTTALAFTRLGGSSVTYTAGTNGGLQLNSQAFSILLDTNSGLVIGAAGIKIDTTQLATLGIMRKFALDIPAATGGSGVTITHNFATRDVIVQVYDNTSYLYVLHEEGSARTTNTVTIVFGATITNGQYRVVIGG